MRIISGRLGGRRIHPPAKMPHTRPTTDIAKEGLFNMLQHQLDFDGMETLDLFGGTGSITYELCSRGAGPCVVVEKDPQMHAFIQKNVRDWALPATVLRMDVFKYLETCNQTFDFIFAGPPYALAEIDELPIAIIGRKLLHPDGLFVLEHTPRNDYKTFAGYWKERNYGTTIFSLFQPPEPNGTLA